MTTEAIAYLRVSTQRQGQSGLGLEAQREAVAAMATSRGLTITAEFTETESGRKINRPQLAAALEAARSSGAVVIVAKLDRIARDAELVLRLSREAEANGLAGFLFCDLPDIDATTSAGRLILSVMAGVAEFEARRISERTKGALAAKKQAGGKLGAQLPHVQEANAARSAEAIERARALAYRILPLRNEGLSLAAIADRLHDQGVPTPSGKGRWRAETVSRTLKRLQN